MLKQSSSKAAVVLFVTALSTVAILFTPLGEKLTPGNSFAEFINGILQNIFMLLGDNLFEVFRIASLPLIFGGTLALGYWIIITAFEKRIVPLLAIFIPAIIYMNIVAIILILLVLFHNFRFGF